MPRGSGFQVRVIERCWSPEYQVQVTVTVSCLLPKYQVTVWRQCQEYSKGTISRQKYQVAVSQWNPEYLLTDTPQGPEYQITGSRWGHEYQVTVSRWGHEYQVTVTVSLWGHEYQITVSCCDPEYEIRVQSYFSDRLQIRFYGLRISETAAMSPSISKPSSSRLKSTYRKEDFTIQYGIFLP
jgi:hypothetical protein